MLNAAGQHAEAAERLFIGLHHLQVGGCVTEFLFAGLLGRMQDDDIPGTVVQEGSDGAFDFGKRLVDVVHGDRNAQSGGLFQQQEVVDVVGIQIDHFNADFAAQADAVPVQRRRIDDQAERFAVGEQFFPLLGGETLVVPFPEVVPLAGRIAIVELLDVGHENIDAVAAGFRCGMDQPSGVFETAAVGDADLTGQKNRFTRSNEAIADLNFFPGSLRCRHLLVLSFG